MYHICRVKSFDLELTRTVRELAMAKGDPEGLREHHILKCAGRAKRRRRFGYSDASGKRTVIPMRLERFEKSLWPSGPIRKSPLLDCRQAALRSYSRPPFWYIKTSPVRCFKIFCRDSRTKSGCGSNKARCRSYRWARPTPLVVADQMHRSLQL